MLSKGRRRKREEGRRNRRIERNFCFFLPAQNCCLFSFSPFHFFPSQAQKERSKTTLMIRWLTLYSNTQCAPRFLKEIFFPNHFSSHQWSASKHHLVGIFSCQINFCLEQVQVGCEVLLCRVHFIWNGWKGYLLYLSYFWLAVLLCFSWIEDQVFN